MDPVRFPCKVDAGSERVSVTYKRVPRTNYSRTDF